MQNTNLALALDTQADIAAQEKLRDELAQFISEELIAPQVKTARTLVRRRSVRRIHIDNGIFKAFRVR
jgi:hypothetical protein